MRFYGHDLPSARHILHRLDEYIEMLPDTVHISKLFLIIDYLFSLLAYGCGVMDYFLYEFYYLNRRGKKSFITVKQRVLFDNKNNATGGVETVLNKEKALLHFKKYISRDWCGQEFHNTELEYGDFCAKYDRCIVKPLKELGGCNVSIIPTDVGGGKTLFQYCKEHGFLAEQLIEQHSIINEMYPKAINTIRIVTVRGNCVAAAMRIGTGGSEVDNAHAGGIFAEIDLDSGIIISKAMNYYGKEFVRHPDSDTIIPGFQIPFWEEAKYLAVEASDLIKEVALIGWDIAITPTGPTIVEVNHMPSLELVQAPRKKGMAWAMSGKKDYE